MKMLMLATFALVALAVLPGCVDHFGTGGTGETVVPERRLREVEPDDFSRFATTRPADTNPVTQPTDFPPPQVTLSIAECRAAALQNNLHLKVELFNPAVARTSITEAEAQYEAMFNAGLGYNQNKSPPAGGVPPFTQYNVTPDVNLTVPLRTGGFLKFDAPYQYINNLGVTSPLNPSNTFTPNVTFNQPLLRGFGYDVNAQAIRVAFYGYQQTQARTKLEVTRVLASVDRAYWALFASRAQREVRRKQHELAVAQLDRARRQAAAGMVADVDIVRAESGVADQVEQIILSENDVRQKERDLKRILNRPDLPLDVPTEVLPGTPPSSIELQPDAPLLADAALSRRMEMLDIELQLASEAANVRIARNALLPVLAVQYSYGHNGYSGSPRETFSQVWEKDYASHNAGLVLSFPIGNEAARSALRRAMLARLQQLATKAQRTIQIRQEVFNASDNLTTDWQRILAAHKRVDLARRTRDVEIRQFNQGLRTSTDVLDAQARLADAQSSEISAIADYQVAQVDLAFATGAVLGAARVRWEPAAAPR